MVQIFKWFNGTNDIPVEGITEDRLNLTMNWSFEHLKLFKNCTKIINFLFKNVF